MQEAFGGSFLLKLFIIFFIIYVCFIGIALNFAKTYRVKNYVINTLEQQQYRIGDDLSNLEDWLKKVPYNSPIGAAESDCQKYSDSGYNTIVFNGVCIVSKGEEELPYYKVTVYFGAEFPFLGLNITIPVSGETTTISSITSSLESD